MKGKALIYLVLPLVIMLMPGCMPDKTLEERMKWRLNPDDARQPYGDYLARQSLKYFFPGAAIETLPAGFRYDDIDAKMKHNNEGRSLLILEGLDFEVSEEEWKELKAFIANGNEVVLLCSRLDSKIEEALNCFKKNRSIEDQTYYVPRPEKENMHVLVLTGDPSTTYGYQGRSLYGYFDIKGDSSDTVSDSTANTDEAYNTYFTTGIDTLGYADGHPDFVRFYLGDGHLTLHAAPLALSNYFLLQSGNENYLAGIWQTLPDHITHVYWHNYFRRTEASAGLSILFRYPATRLAIILAVIAMLIYVLFESKRKQRVIPVIEPLKNDSVSFVETVGRLYYNKGNHANLAFKMTNQFLEWVRGHYFLNTNLLNEDFIRLLTLKSGQPEATVRALMDMVHEVKLGTAYTDEAYLYQLYNTIQLFYKNNHK